MNIKKILAAALCLSIVFLAIVFADTEDGIDAQGLAYQEYDKMMDFFERTRGVDEYPDYYAGAYLGDDGKLVVLTTDQAAATSDLNINAVYAPADYSLNELHEIRDVIREYMINNIDGSVSENLVGYGIDEVNNRVLVSLITLNAETQKEFEDTVIKSNALRFEECESLYNLL